MTAFVLTPIHLYMCNFAPPIYIHAFALTKKNPMRKLLPPAVKITTLSYYLWR